jgi:hypothetical protein
MLMAEANSTTTHSVGAVRQRRAVLIVALSLIGVGLTTTAQAASTSHLDWAMSVAINVTPANNAYGTKPAYVTWPGVAGATIYSNRSDCSSFITKVLQQAYGWTSTYFRTWTGSTSPTAARYHDTIAAQNRFARITSIAGIAPGDLLAAKYLTPTSTATGHVMWATGVPVPRTASKPIVAGTTQYELQVVDSASTGHGPTDTRRRADGTYEDGAGIGVIRLYADANGQVIGYTWSTLSASVYYDATTRPLAIGRLP